MIGQLYLRTTLNQSLLILFTHAKLFRHRLVPIPPVLYGVVSFKFMIIDLLHITLRRSCWYTKSNKTAFILPYQINPVRGLLISYLCKHFLFPVVFKWLSVGRYQFTSILSSSILVSKHPCKPKRILHGCTCQSESA